jgi:coenzyme F420-reducing hydrogenase beta subunit
MNQKKPRAMTLTPHACPGGHPQCECGAYTDCCSFVVQREELFAFTTLCGDCSEPICENCAAWFETDDPSYGRCVGCAPEERRREKRTNTGEIVSRAHIKAMEEGR